MGIYTFDCCLAILKASNHSVLAASVVSTRLWAYVDVFRYMALVLAVCVPLAFVLLKAHGNVGREPKGEFSSLDQQVGFRPLSGFRVTHCSITHAATLPSICDKFCIGDE